MLDETAGGLSGIMLINGLHLSMTPPPVRSEPDYGDRVFKKMETALSIAEDRNLIPVICGPLSRRAWDMAIFKRLFEVISRHPQVVFVPYGDMLNKRGEVKPNTIMDLIASTSNVDVFSPANEDVFEAFLDQGVFRLVPAEGGEFNVSFQGHDDSRGTFVISRDQLPHLARVTLAWVKEPSSVVVLEGSSHEVVVIDKTEPVLSDAKYDVIEDVDPEFESQLVSRIQAMLSAGETEDNRTTDEQLKEVFQEMETSLEARSIIMSLKDHVSGI